VRRRKRTPEFLYLEKEEKGWRMVRMLFGLESDIGELPIRQGRLLYLSFVDPHLTHGCDVIMDGFGTQGGLERLEKVELHALRRLLGVRYSATQGLPKDFAYMELDVKPLRFRRVFLGIRFLSYLQSRPTNTLVWDAYQDALQLGMKGHHSWIGDLVYAVQHLVTGGGRSISIEAIANGQSCQALLTKMVEELMATSMSASIAGSKGIMMTLRREPPKAGHLPRQEMTLMAFRHYLKVVHDNNHRKAVTRLMFSEHYLRVETWRQRRPVIPRDERMCRHCNLSSESELHALFMCDGLHELQVARDKLRTTIEATDRRAAGYVDWRVDEGCARELMRRLYGSHDDRIVRAFAAFVFEVLELFPKEDTV
jgi:hypothetical protein